MDGFARGLEVRTMAVRRALEVDCSLVLVLGHFGGEIRADAQTALGPLLVFRSGERDGLLVW
jgi:hypothetical protein